MTLRPSIFDARRKLAEGRDKARVQHQAKSPGIQVCAFLTDVVDSVIMDLYHAALEESPAETAEFLALAPNGGYGRRDIAPFSDVDLMILVEAGKKEEVAPFIRLLQNSIYDVGLQMVPSVRTRAEACSQAWGDATIFTSLAESRFLAGNAELFHSMMTRFRRQAKRRSASLILKIEKERRKERSQYGETVYLLEPNVKRSRGGLRDLQLLRWIGFARYGEVEPENLERSGILTREDRQRLRSARDFLLRLRNELHFQAGKAQDVLGKDEQLRISELFGYTSNEATIAVEAFLRDYIEHTSDVRYIVTHFVDSAKPRRNLSHWVDPLFSHQVARDFRVSPLRISATRQGLAKVSQDLAETLRLMDLSNQYNVRIDRPTWQAIRAAMANRQGLTISPVAVERFLSMMSQPGRLGDLLRRLHELRVLEQLIPPMAHARSLMQFNDYHKYTVDEHSIRAVECATNFWQEDGPVGEAYRGIRDKRLLHLALLLHDLGKGFDEDHSEVGARLADEVSARFGLTPRDQETLRFLVHKHLRMSHLAQRRDLNDDAVIIQFAVEVGSADILQMLYVLTCADLAAVGPGVLNGWKTGLITQLYRRTRARLVGDRLADTQTNEDERAELRRLTRDRKDPDWWAEQISALPHSYYVSAASATDMAAELDALQSLPQDGVAAWGRFLPEQNAMEYSVGTYEDLIPGVFHRLTGALTSKGHQILNAEIHTLARGLVLDRFYATDMDFNGKPPDERINEVCEALRHVVACPTDEPPPFRRMWSEGREVTHEEVALPTRVRIDTNTSEQFTILDIFTHDQLGLLYIISRKIFELDLSVHMAKIGTYLDQVVDVFYVTDRDNRKVVDAGRLEHVRLELLAAIENHSAAAHTSSS